MKLTTAGVGFIPGIGGKIQGVMEKVTDSVEAKKQQKRAEAEGKQAEADAWAAKAAQLNGDLGAVAGVVAGAGANMFTKGITEGAYNGASKGFTDGLGTVGASVADSTIKAWFTKHWKHILMVIGGLGAVWLIKKQMDKNPKRRARPAYRR
ncbi:MAG: hypothetical protein ABIP27_19185 [Flavobacterium circumlabens]|uniref:hypothetical protein n=1 Tax=Flavobacterium circumlabens TaxID=2133765 RepID=UPI003266919A